MDIHKKSIIIGGLFFYFFSLANCAVASELLTGAYQMDGKSWNVSVYGGQSRIKPVITMENSGSIHVPVSGGGTQDIFVSNGADQKMTADQQNMVASIEIRPRDGLVYRLKAGTVQSYSVAYDSGSIVNNLQATRPGILWGMGLRWNVTQATPVSTAFSFDLGYTRTDLTLDKFQSNGQTEASDIHWSQDEFQLAFMGSRRIKRVEPYAGIKIARLYSALTGNDTKGRLKGQVDEASALVGAKIEMFDREYVTVEGSWFDEKSLHAGFNLSF